MSKFIDGSFNDSFFDSLNADTDAKTYNIYKRFPWSSWEFGTVEFCYKKLYSGSLDKLDVLTNGQIIKDHPEYYI